MSNLLRVTGIQGAARIEPSRGLVLAAAGVAVQGNGGFPGNITTQLAAQNNLGKLTLALSQELDIANAAFERVQPDNITAVTLKDLVQKAERQLAGIRAGTRITLIQGIQASVAAVLGGLA